MAANTPSGSHQLSSGPQFSIAELDAALAAEIKADHNERRLHPVKLGRGRRHSASKAESIYEFLCDEPLRKGDRGVFATEAHRCRAEVTGRRIDKKGRPTVKIRLQASFGDIAPGGTLTLDPGPLERLRRHLADLPAGFNEDLALRTVGARPRSGKLGSPDLDWLSEHLNEGQLDAVAKTFSHPVSITWGPPGTGKTKTLVAAAEAHLRQGHTVLVAAPTHGALDRALEVAQPWLETIPGYGEGAVLRLGKIRCPALSGRMGAQVELGQVHRRLTDRHLEELKTLTKALDSASTIEEHRALADRRSELQLCPPLKVGALAHRAKVVFATTHRGYLSPLVPPMGPLVTKSTILVDEAGMVGLPLLFVISGLATQRVALFGDFRQLPPVVKSRRPDARRWLGGTGFDGHQIPAAVSAENDPPHLTVLTEQYRMVPSICAFVSDLSYGGRLRTAPTLRKIQSEVSALLGGGLHLLDTSRLDSTTDFKGRSRFNEVHAELIVELVRSIEEDLSNPATCLLVTPFRAQAQILNRSLRREHLRTRASTVHRAQGAEADVVIVDLVETDAFNVSPFLTARGPDNEGARLLNVAVSRAKRAAVVVAAVDPLLHSPATGRYVKAFLATLRQDANPLDPTAYRRQADSLAA